MTARRTLTALCGIAALALLIGGRHADALARRERAAGVALHAQNQAGNAADGRNEAELGLAETERARLAQEYASLRALAPLVKAAAPAAPSDQAQQQSLAEEEQRKRGYRARLAAQYGPLFVRLGLRQDQIDQFETAMTNHWEETADLQAVAQADHLGGQDASVAKLQAQDDVDLKLAETGLLGDDGCNQLQDYERSLPVRDFVTTIAEHLYYTDSPLNGSQADALTRILAANSPGYAQGGAASPQDIQWPAALPAARALLSPVQLAALNFQLQLLTDQQAMTQLSAELEKATALGAGH